MYTAIIGYRFMILNSVDGLSWNKLIAYPATWTAADVVIEQAKRAIERGQQAGGEEWSWDDVEGELSREGFKMISFVQGPVWDEKD